MALGRHMGDFHEVHRELLYPLVCPAPSADAVERMRGHQARLRQSLYSTSRVLIGNLEDLCDLVGRHEGPVVFYILQNVRGAPLREARLKVNDVRLQQLSDIQLTLND